ncbi:MAG: DM13 domain-containing protein [Pseudomonadota bacterium]
MKRFLTRTLFIRTLFAGLIVTMLMPVAVLKPVPAHAQLLDIIKGHTRDITTRFADDEIIDGVVIKSGMIDEDAPGQDPVHYGRGSIMIVEAEDGLYVQTGPDFKIGLAPDLYIYVSSATPIDDEEDFYSTEQIELGVLKKGSGASFYKLPPDIEINSVTVMCKKFRQYMASAQMMNVDG